MRPCPEESVNWDTTENLYIEGDNLDALKILRETYAGKIKMIYIDPPYNTGHDFVYNDTFARSAEEERAESGAFDEEGNVLDAAYKVNNESNGKFHSDWCSMMYPRLVLARDLLSDDGVLFISMNECEHSNLMKVCEEIFGQDNFVTNFVWEKGKEGGNDSSIMRSHYDNIVCFCKDSDSDHVINLDPKDTSRHICHDKEPNLVAGIRSYSNDGEPFQLINLSKQKDYSVVIPLIDGTEITWPSYAPQKTIDRWVVEGKLFVGAKRVPYVKSYLKDELQGQKPSNIIGQNYGTTKAGSIEIRDFFGNRQFFPYPKPSILINRLTSIGAVRGSIVLDFFSGSATTAHAVMQLNAEDGGNRKFIMVQLPEVCDEKSEAAKAGYSTICEIGKERIRRAGKKIVDELKPGKKIPDIGFRVLKIDSSNFEDVSRTPDTLFQDALFSLADNVKPGRTPEDILFQLFPKLEIPYTAHIDTFDICGKTVYSVDDDTLVACFDREVPEDVIRAMAEREPAWAVLRDASFTGDDALANFEEIFKTVSPETKTRVV